MRCAGARFMVGFRVTKLAKYLLIKKETDSRTLDIGRWTYLYDVDSKICKIGKNNEIDVGYHLLFNVFITHIDASLGIAACSSTYAWQTSSKIMSTQKAAGMNCRSIWINKRAYRKDFNQLLHHL